VRKRNSLAVIVIVVVLSVSATWWLFRDRITFAMDRRYVEDTLVAMDHPKGLKELGPCPPIEQPPRSLVAVGSPTHRCKINGSSVAFCGEGFAPSNDSPNAYHAEDCVLFFFDSSGNEICLPGHVPSGIRSTRGGACIASYLASNDPFDILKALHAAKPEDLDQAAALCDRYRSLYLSSMKIPMIWVNSTRLREYSTPTARVLLSGDFPGKLIAEVYFPSKRMFIDVVFAPRKGCDLGRIERILSSIVIEDGGPPK
jgi:hypothetical protein